MNWLQVDEHVPNSSEPVVIAMRETEGGWGGTPTTYKWVYRVATWDLKKERWSIMGSVSSNYSSPLLWADIPAPPVEIEPDKNLAELN
jgi:hypothetical protein